MQKEQDPATRLVADAGPLFVIDGLRKQNFGTFSTGRSESNPAFMLQLRIFGHDEAEFATIKLDGFFVVPNDKCSVNDAGNHGIPREQTNKVHQNSWPRRFRISFWFAWKGESGRRPAPPGRATSPPPMDPKGAQSSL